MTSMFCDVYAPRIWMVLDSAYRRPGTRRNAVGWPWTLRALDLAVLGALTILRSWWFCFAVDELASSVLEVSVSWNRVIPDSVYGWLGVSGYVGVWWLRTLQAHGLKMISVTEFGLWDLLAQKAEFCVFQFRDSVHLVDLLLLLAIFIWGDRLDDLGAFFWKLLECTSGDKTLRDAQFSDSQECWSFVRCKMYSKRVGQFLSYCRDDGRCNTFD